MESSRPTIVLVSGGRDHGDPGFIGMELSSIREHYGEIFIIEGGASGADKMARDWASLNGVYCATVPALWRHKRREEAGPHRNGAMLWLRPDVCVCFPTPRSRGTWNMKRQAEEAGIPTYVFQR